MHKALLVAVYEYLLNLRRPAFLIATFGAPLFSIGIMLLVLAVVGSTEDNPGALGGVGYVDEADVLTVADDFVPFETDAAARAALDEGTIGAYFIIEPDYMSTGDVTIVSMSGVPEAIEDSIDTALIASLSERIDSTLPVERIRNPVDLVIRSWDRGSDLQEDAAPILIMLPIFYALVFFIAAQTTSGYLMSSVVEEKSNRVMEILITSVTPLELLFGKIVGLGLLGLTQLAIWLGLALVGLNLGQGAAILSGIELPLDLVLISLAYFLASYFVFAGFLAGAGAISNTEQESRQFAGIFVLINTIPFIVFPLFILSPESPITLALSLIPFTAPITMIIRLSLGAVPIWQLVASFSILLLTAVVVVWGAARVFRWSLLLYGKRPTPRELWRVIRGTQDTRIGTVAQEQSA